MRVSYFYHSEQTCKRREHQKQYGLFSYLTTNNCHQDFVLSVMMISIFLPDSDRLMGIETYSHQTDVPWAYRTVFSDNKYSYEWFPAGGSGAGSVCADAEGEAEAVDASIHTPLVAGTPPPPRLQHHRYSYISTAYAWIHK